MFCHQTLEAHIRQLDSYVRPTASFYLNPFGLCPLLHQMSWFDLTHGLQTCPYCWDRLTGTASSLTYTDVSEWTRAI